MRPIASLQCPLPSLSTRRSLLLTGGLWAAAALGGCALRPPGPRTLDISEAQLVERIARQFPLQRRVLEVFELTLQEPRVRLLPEENRIGTDLAYVVGRPARPSSRALRGRLRISYGLRLDAEDLTVRLQEVRVESPTDLDLPGPMVEHAGRMGGMLAEELLRDFVVYRIRPEDLQGAAQQGYRPTRLTVVPGGLQLRLDPLPSP